jgi:preprotein translocase subunit SecG
MELIKTILQVVNVLTAVAVIVLVLVQHGKGADMGAAFGSGSAGSLFGSSGSANFLSRSTAVCATIFFSTLFALVYVDAYHVSKNDAGVVSGVTQNASAKPGSSEGKPVIPN